MPVKDVYGLGVGKFGGSYPLPLKGALRSSSAPAGTEAKADAARAPAMMNAAILRISKPVKFAARDVKENARTRFRRAKFPRRIVFCRGAEILGLFDFPRACAKPLRVELRGG